MSARAGREHASSERAALDQDLAALAAFAADCAGPVAANLIDVVEREDGAAYREIAADVGLGDGAPARLVLRALGTALDRYAGGTAPRAAEDFERAAGMAADRIVAGLRASAARLGAGRRLRVVSTRRPSR